LDGVIYASLGRRFREDGRPATADEVVAYLGNLTGAVREAAEEYARRAHPQINTAY
jgi:hypothetical protein